MKIHVGQLLKIPKDFGVVATVDRDTYALEDHGYVVKVEEIQEDGTIIAKSLATGKLSPWGPINDNGDYTGNLQPL